MTGWCWFGLVNGNDRSPLASAEAEEDGHRIGVLGAWGPEHPPFDGAMKIDAAAIDADGDPAWVSLSVAPAGACVPFDDPAVSEAIRTVLAGPAFDVVSTLLVGDRVFAGALVAVFDDPRRLADDPFARLFHARVVRVDAGLLGRASPPVGPGIQRYGSTTPWPGGRFDPAPG